MTQQKMIDDLVFLAEHGNEAQAEDAETFARLYSRFLTTLPTPDPEVRIEHSPLKESDHLEVFGLQHRTDLPTVSESLAREPRRTTLPGGSLELPEDTDKHLLWRLTRSPLTDLLCSWVDIPPIGKRQPRRDLGLGGEVEDNLIVLSAELRLQ
jgi:hypothetical protein